MHCLDHSGTTEIGRVIRMSRLVRRFCMAAVCLALLSHGAGTAAFAFGPPSRIDSLEARVGHPITAKTLIEILSESDDDELCKLAIGAAMEFGPDAKEFVPQLIAALDSDRPLSRCSAAGALREIGPAAAAAVPALIQVLGQETHDSTRQMAAGALGHIGLATPAGVEALAAVFSRGNGDDEFYVRWAAADALARLGGDARAAVPALIGALKTEQSSHIREAVAEALGRVAGPGDKVVISVLTRIAQLESRPIPVGDGDQDDSQEGSVRIAAALALWRITHNRRVVEWLVAPLKDKDDVFWIREKAMQALGEIGPDAAAAVPALIPLVTDYAKKRDDHRCSHAAVVALGRIGPAAKSAVPVLIGEFGQGNDRGFHELAAAQALAGIGPAAREALPALRSALECDVDELRIAAGEAIRRVGGDVDGTVPALIDCLLVLDIPNFFGPRSYGVLRAARVRARAAQALGALGVKAGAAVAPLGALLEDDFITVREAAADALQKIENR